MPKFASTPSKMTDTELAAHLAEVAGRILLDVRGSGMFEGKALGKAGDQTANQFLMHALQVQRPDDGLLSEESKDTDARLSKQRTWIIDPVDGTREYGEERADWAVHVGMAVDGVAELGAVALPGRDMVLRSDQLRALPAAASKPRFVVSRTRPAKEAQAVCEAMGGEMIGMGSAGAKAMAIVLGEAEVYLHSGGRRFAARPAVFGAPSGSALGSTGFCSPNAMTKMRSSAMPRSISHAATANARASDASRLALSLPPASL